ncbi:MAG TPA: ATP-binding protein [Candidatus Saccharimonadales bacterium]|nr:ATP-binding protein [Candidatus Saccharimonadales bacterium]
MILVLGLSLGGGILAYREGTGGFERLLKSHGLTIAPGPETDPSLIVSAFKDIEAWSKQSALIVAAGAGGLGVLIVIILSTVRYYSARRLAKYEDEVSELGTALEKAGTDLMQHRTERRRLENELQKLNGEIERKIQERTAQLSASHTQMQKELNDRRQAERVMAQQAKELERSKDVLELHVQARTQELQKLQRRYESILNSAGEGIYGLDLQGRTTFVNPAAAKITGWKVEELVSKLESEVFHRLAANPADAAEQTTPADYQLFYRKDGTSFPAEYVRTPIREKDKEVGAVVIFKDITERKRAEETLSRKAAELARSNAELEQFAYVASHDLQEPLRKIQAFGDRLKTKCDAVNLQDGRDYLERMQSAAARMQTLINDLLTFSRVISASQPFVPVDLNQVVKGVLSDLEVRIEQKKATVEVGELPSIEADPLQMRQLLQNLIGNALKFQTPNSHPVVKIHARLLKSPFAGTPEEDPYAEQCEFTVEDNGIGFDEKYLDKIFAVFQRLHGRNEYEGTGVGLAVCRRITDRHGGTITARSKQGEGAKFIVTVPVRHLAQKELAA